MWRKFKKKRNNARVGTSARGAWPAVACTYVDRRDHAIIAILILANAMKFQIPIENIHLQAVVGHCSKTLLQGEINIFISCR